MAHVDDLWTSLARLRAELATHADFSTAPDYAWAYLGRTWSLADADRLCERVLDQVVPVLAAMEGPRPPWPIEAPGPAPDDLVGTVISALRALDPELADRFGAFELRIGPTELSGGSQIWRPERRRSTIRLRTTGTASDVDTLVHETGHALHCAFARSAAPMRAVEIPNEVAELASCGLERLVDRSDRAVRRSLRAIASSTAAHRFQRRAYADPTADRCALWAEVWRESFPHHTTGDRGTGWLAYPHLTLYPFYCLEYTVAELGALRLAPESDGVARYRAFLQAPPGTPAIGAYAAAGLPLLPDRLLRPGTEAAQGPGGGA